MMPQSVILMKNMEGTTVYSAVNEEEKDIQAVGKNRHPRIMPHW